MTTMTMAAIVKIVKASNGRTCPRCRLPLRRLRSERDVSERAVVVIELWILLPIESLFVIDGNVGFEQDHAVASGAETGAGQGQRLKPAEVIGKTANPDPGR